MSVTTLCSGSSLSTTHRNVPSHDLTVERCGADRRGAFWSLDTDLFPPPALCERCHRGLARRFVAVRRRAILMLPKGQRPHPRRIFGRPPRSGLLRTPADVMLVFGDVGELRKVAESADDLDALTMREAIQCRLELVPRGFIFVAVEADRGPANALNDREDRLAFLAADRIPKNAAEKTDIVT